VAPTGRLIRNIDIAYKLDINPRAVRARFVVRVVSTGRVGTVDTALQQIVVPPLPPAAPAP
jgi:ethanolamine utilization microcompartment shell protein EutS